MAEKTVSALLSGCNVSLPATADTTLVRGIAYDSRTVKPGYLFFAISGQHADGHDYIEDAVRRGAVACVHSKPLTRPETDLCFVRCENPRAALSAAAHRFFDAPSEQLTVIGVTGTDGKSSTVFFIHQLLEALGLPSGFLSTVAMQVGTTAEKNTFRQSTPEAPELHGFLAEMVAHGKRYAVVEATSHGLSSRTSRLSDLRFSAGVFTNLSHEHLEFHGSFEQYRSDKANLFRRLTPPPQSHGGRGAVAVLNAADAASEYYRALSSAPVATYALGGERADVRAELLDADLDGSRFSVEENGRSVELTLPIPGSFQVENALAAVTAVSRVTGITISELSGGVARLRTLPGRMTNITTEAPFRVIVDYAHTPGSYERLFPFVRRFTEGRVVALFGSAGERDIEKRAIQGRIAAAYCDEIYVTDEDPRLEEGSEIIEQIAAGVLENAAFTRDDNLHCIADRSVAIRRAIRTARPGDTLLLLGKGHESNMIYADGPIPWDEIRTAGEAVRECGYDAPQVAGQVV